VVGGLDQLQHQLIVDSRLTTYFLAGAAFFGLAGCGGQSAAAAPPAHRAVHVDSILPRGEALRRCQAGARRVDTLSGGALSRDALVREFVRGIEARDIAALRRLALDRDEFAFLYYPTAPQGQPPYDLEPGLLWFTLESGSHKGLARALESRGGQSLGFERYHCDSIPSRQGANTVWGPCMVRSRRKGVVAEERLFGLIIERAGRFKFVDYGNRL
jgi:hypothetical protein